MRLNDEESRGPVSSADWNLEAVTSMADLEERLHGLHVQAGTPNPGQVHRLSRGPFEVPKSTAARWLRPWAARTPRLEVVLGLVSAYGVPEHELGLWRAAYGRARDGSPTGIPARATSEATEAPSSSKLGRNPILISCAAATVLVLALVGWAAFAPDGQPDRQAAPAPSSNTAATSVPQITTPPPLNADQLSAFKTPQALNLPLITQWTIPQQPFDLDRFEPTQKADEWDLSIECRPARCPAGEGRMYTVLPVPGISFVAVVEGSSVDDPQPCVTASYQRESLPLTIGRLFCVRTGNRMAVLRAVDLPQDVPADQVLVKLEIAVWSLAEGGTDAG